MEKKLVHKVDPVYPPLAQAARLSGSVLLDVLIAPDGSVAEIRVEHGHPLLVKSAMEAVRQWSYKPTTVGGSPVEVVTQVEVPFRPE